jgi:hypothetical protein
VSGFNSASLFQALTALGKELSSRNLHFEVVAIGGGGLLLLGLIRRSTSDLDLVALVDKGDLISAHTLPQPLAEAITAVGIALGLSKEWINTGPADLLSLGLPEGFLSRVETQDYGGLILHLAGRFDQICFKLYAAVDQGPSSKHYSDLKLLSPTREELDIAAKWCKTHDVSEGFAADLSDALTALKD